MIWRDINGPDLRSFLSNFNQRMRLIFINLYENAKFKKISIKENTISPTAETGILTIYSDAPGVVKVIFSDGTIKTFTLT